MTDLSTKQALRRHALALRDLIEPREAHAAAESVARRGLALVQKISGPGAVVSAYWPIRSEISTRPLLEALANAGYRTALPVVTATARPLRFLLWTPGEDLDVGPLGLAEPKAGGAVGVPDILFAPLAAFDARGHRIGYGGGNFDATIEALRAVRPLTTIGLAYGVQEVDRVPAEEHDQRLDFVLTEQRIFSCGASS